MAYKLYTGTAHNLAFLFTANPRTNLCSNYKYIFFMRLAGQPVSLDGGASDRKYVNMDFITILKMISFAKINELTMSYYRQDKKN
jgi:hypothetical protein